MLHLGECIKKAEVAAGDPIILPEILQEMTASKPSVSVKASREYNSVLPCPIAKGRSSFAIFSFFNS